MKRIAGTAVILWGLLLLLSYTPSYGQRITSGADTVAVPQAVSAADTAQQKRFFLSRLGDLDRPGKAALLSAALPGLGQAYNKAYWKIPIVYATGAVLGYFLIENNNQFQDFRTAYIYRTDGNPNTVDQYVDHPVLGTASPNAVAYLRNRRDYYRRNRDLTVLLSVLAYTLNIAEAYVHAHMREFDISDNLVLRMQPNLIHVPANANVAPGLTLTLYTSSK